MAVEHAWVPTGHWCLLIPERPTVGASTHGAQLAGLKRNILLWTVFDAMPQVRFD